MTGKIIGKRVVPDVFEVYERDVNTKAIKFSVNKVNDGVNFLELDGYAHINFESDRTDRVLLSKTVGDSDILYELSITRAITQEEGRHRIQLSFEKDDLTVVYKTCIFTFTVCESIDGSLAYENVVPSVAQELEDKMEQTLLECSKIKDEVLEVIGDIDAVLDAKTVAEESANSANQACQTVQTLKGEVESAVSNAQSIKESVDSVFQEIDAIKTDCAFMRDDILNEKDTVYSLKEDSYQYSQEALNACEETKQFYNNTIQGSYVTSINNKKGDVILTASDIEGLDNIELQPLFIDGVKYDGKTQVEVSTSGKSYQIAQSQFCDLHLENNKCYLVRYVERLKLYSDLLEGLNGSSSEIYMQIDSEMELHASGKFYFYGDGCHFGIFQPFAGYYYLRFYSVENNGKIYVEVKKLEYISWSTGTAKGFPVVVNYNEPAFVNQITISGNTDTEIVNGEETFAYPIKGVGEPVIDENGNQKYKISITTQNANMLSVEFFSDAVDSYCVDYDTANGYFNFYGTSYMEYESFCNLQNPILKGSTVYINAFNIASNINSELTSGNILEFSLFGSSGELAKIAIDYTGNPCLVDGVSNSVTLQEDVWCLKVKVLENAIGMEFNNTIGITISKNNPMQEFEKSEFRMVDVYIDAPLLKIGTNTDILNLKTGIITRPVAVKSIESKEELEPLNDSEDAPAIIRYGTNFPSHTMYNTSIWIHGKSLEESMRCVETNSTKYLVFKKDVFGSYNNFDESVFPIRLMYYTSVRQEKVPVTPMVRVFKGDTTYYVSGGESPSNGSVPLAKK